MAEHDRCALYPDDEEPPELTVESVRAALQASAAGADELRETLEHEHLVDLSRSMGLRLRGGR